MGTDQELRTQREALAQAVNRHDIEAVKAFIHPSYVGQSKRGRSVGYEDMMRLAEQLLAPGGDFEEEVEIEDITVTGDKARITVRRTHAVTAWLWIKSRATTRAVETWWQVDGRWQLVEEQEL